MWTEELERRVMNSRLRRFFHRRYEFPVYEALLARAGVQIGPTTRVLDAGCGAGFASLLVQEKSRSAAHYAFDLRPDQVYRARRQLPAPVRLFAGDLCHLAMPAGALDVVLTFGVFHHLPWQQALGEMRRVLRPGGVLLGTEPQHDNPPLYHWKEFFAGLGRAGLLLAGTRPVYMKVFTAFLCFRDGKKLPGAALD